MPEAEKPDTTHSPQLESPQSSDEKPADVDLEELARQVWLLIKASLREENDRLGRN